MADVSRPPRGPGRPDCPDCGGLGWLHPAVPVDHPHFGQAVPCACLAATLAAERRSRNAADADLGALSGMTFETFRTDAAGNSPEGKRSLEAAFDAARAFAESPSDWLVLHGGFGCGKTHLAAAIVNDRLAAGEPALFVVVPDLLDRLRAAYAPDSEEAFEDRFAAVRDAPLLVLDDLGTQAPTAWAAEKLFQLLNHRYTNRLPTVVTTNCAIDDLDARLQSRLGHWGMVRQIEIKALDYRGGVRPESDLVSTLNLYADMTFENWDARAAHLEPSAAENLARAHGVARAYADEPSGWLVLTGDHGVGKTHLAAAIANRRVALGGSALFVVVPDLLDHLRAAFSPTSRVTYDRRFDEIRAAELLVLDDLGTESATPWAREKLFQILNHRYAARLATVVTMSTALKDIDPWLRTRMLDRRRCTVFEILAWPYFGGPPAPRPSNPPRRPRRG
jgi:DNA replication protein DnaC